MTYGVEVKAITEHQLPVGDGLERERLQGAVDGENHGGGVQQGGGQPVDADPVVLGAGDASLSILERSCYARSCEYFDRSQVKGRRLQRKKPHAMAVTTICRASRPPIPPRTALLLS